MSRNTPRPTSSRSAPLERGRCRSDRTPANRRYGIETPTTRSYSRLPGPYQNLFLCGISTQLHQVQANWDELIQPPDADFAISGLHRASIIRLSYLYAADPSEISGAIGRIDSVRLKRLRQKLSDHLRL